MRCPRCTYPLAAYSHDGTELDHCDRCGGTYVDPGEAKALLAAEAEAEAWKNLWATEAKGRTALRCPRDTTRLDAYAVRFKTEHVEVDVCSRCGGMWLDADEGHQLAGIMSKIEGEELRREEKPGAATFIFQMLSGFPLEVWNPVRNKPVTVYALLVTLVVFFLAQGTVFSGVLASQPGLLLHIPAEFAAGQHLWTVITYGFFHGGLMHIIGNCWFLWVFGDNIEDVLGQKRFLILYGVSLIMGGLLHTLTNAGSTTPMLGASGAIAGLMGAYLYLFPRIRVYLVIVVFRFKLPVILYLGFWIAFQFFMSHQGAGGTAWFAHIGGFLAGVLLAIVFKATGTIEYPDVTPRAV